MGRCCDRRSLCGSSIFLVQSGVRHRRSAAWILFNVLMQLSGSSFCRVLQSAGFRTRSSNMTSAPLRYFGFQASRHISKKLLSGCKLFWFCFSATQSGPWTPITRLPFSAFAKSAIFVGERLLSSSPYSTVRYGVTCLL